MNLADSILRVFSSPQSGILALRSRHLWSFCGTLMALATAVAIASGQQLIDPDQYAAPDIKRVATITSSRDVQPRGLSPGADLALTIIAGKADRNSESERIVSPVAAITDSKGRLLVADTKPLSIRVLDFPRHKYHEINLATMDVESIGGMALSNDGTIYVSDTQRGRVVIVNPEGRFAGYLQNPKEREAYFMSPTGIAVEHHSGSIYVCDRDRHMVIKLDRTGHVLTKIGKRGGGNGPGEFHLPTQIAIRKDEVFVLDSGNHRVQRFDLNGKYLGETPVRAGSGLAADEARLYLSEPDLNRIAVFSRDGSLVSSFSNEPSGGDGRFDPVGLWFASNRCLYVADKANGAVDVLSVGTDAKCR